MKLKYNKKKLPLQLKYKTHRISKKPEKLEILHSHIPEEKLQKKYKGTLDDLDSKAGFKYWGKL